MAFGWFQDWKNDDVIEMREKQGVQNQDFLSSVICEKALIRLICRLILTFIRNNPQRLHLVI